MGQLREQSGVDEAAGGTSENVADAIPSGFESSRTAQDFIPVLPEEEGRPQRGDVNRQKGRHNKRSMFASRGKLGRLIQPALSTSSDVRIPGDSAKEH